MPRTRTPLSAREAAFVRHFIAGAVGVRGCAAKAAVAAGYARRSARSMASDLLLRPRIQAAIEAALAKHELTSARILEEVRRLAFSRMSDFASWGPEGVVLVKSDTLTPEQAAAVAEVHEHVRTRTEVVGGAKDPRTFVVEDRLVWIKLHDKVEALRLAAKVLGLLKDKVELEAPSLFPPGFFEAIVTGDVSKLPPAFRSMPPDAECMGGPEP